jgi:hypothetical protein
MATKTTTDEATNPTKTPEQIKYQPLFELVEDKTNWKNPINSLLDPMDLVELGATKDDLSQAVIFYTGSVPTIKRVGSKYRVVAAGYYAVCGC